MITTKQPAQIAQTAFSHNVDCFCFLRCLLDRGRVIQSVSEGIWLLFTLIETVIDLANIDFGDNNHLSWYKELEETVLIKDVRDSSGRIVTDHLWFNLTKGFQAANLHEGDIVQFDARVAMYQKGYRGHRPDVYCPIEQDYKLSYPTKVKNLGRSPDYDKEPEEPK